jgi:phosphate transport system permease protein
LTLGIAFIGILLIALAVSGISFARAGRLRRGGRLHSLPVYHGAHALIWVLAPALLVLAAWVPMQTRLVDQAVLSSPQGQALPQDATTRSAILSEARQLAHREIAGGFNPQSAPLAPRITEAEHRYSAIGSVAALLFAVGAAGLLFTRKRDRDFRARTAVEKWMKGLLVAASMIAIFTTLGIVLSLLFESLRFFRLVPVHDFLFGLSWSPQTAIRADQAGSSGAFGSIPLFWGTILIGAIIAMIVAIPLGLMSAIYLTQYAAPRVRSVVKPLLEILAGVPTVVYGYFAALTVAPWVRELA